METITIGVDFRPALSRATGVGRYFQGLVAGLARIDHDNDYVLFSSSWKERAAAVARPENFRLVDRRVPVRVLSSLWHRIGAPSLDVLTGVGLDVVHSPTPLIVPSRRRRSIVTVHDLYFLRDPDATRRAVERDYVRLVRDHVTRADAIMVVSETTANDVVDRLDVDPARVCVVHAGLDERFLIRTSANGRENYLLAVATLEPRKNVPALVDAFSVLRRRGWDGRLRIAGGPGIDTPRVDDAIARHGLESAVDKLGYVDDDALRALYRGARAVVMPSLWEGFSLPLLEAMASGVPVVASDIAVHREVAGDAAVFADSSDAAGLADAIERVVSDDSVATELVSRGRERVSRFSWDASAHKVLELYRRVGAPDQ